MLTSPRPWFVSALFLSCLALASTARAAELTASDGEEYGGFGKSISLSGNASLVGSPFLGGAFHEFHKGAAYLFRNLDTASGTVTETAKLTASDGAAGDISGYTVHLSGNSALVGFDTASYKRGAYLFRNLDTASGTVTEAAKLTVSDSTAYDWFGDSISFSGNTGLVGFSEKNTSKGAAYLFRNLDTASGTVAEKAELIASDGEGYDMFGDFISLSGNTALVGAVGHERGAVYLFRNLDTASGTVTEKAKLIASDGVEYDYFGDFISLSGNNGLVGVPYYNFRKGGVYLFRNLDTASGTVTETAKLTASDGSANSGFGASISLSKSTALVVARGTAYLFQNLASASGIIMENVRLTASDDQDRGAYAGSLDGDRFVIAPILKDHPPPYSGGNFTGRVSAFTGRVSVFTVLDDGGVPRSTDGLSFVSRADWIIGLDTDGNRNTLSAGDAGSVLDVGKAVYVGRDAGADNNILTVNGTLTANSVEAGTAGNTGNALFINGLVSTSGGVSAAAGSRIGGQGTLTGDLRLEAGAFLEFSTSSALKVTGSVTLDGSFGTASLSGLDSGTPEGAYPVLSGAPTDFAALGLSNWGAAKAYDLGGGKSAWLRQQGSDLQVVVAAAAVSGELPVLNLSRTGGQLTLAWTTPLSGLVLETGTALSGVWQAVSVTPVINGENYTLTLPLSGDRAFYRLRRP